MKTETSQSKFKGKCFYCNKVGHRKSEYKSRAQDLKDRNLKEDSLSKPTSSGKNTSSKASTGPLPTPGRNRGLSPQNANKATEGCWQAREACFLVTLDSGANSFSWIVDSGCSRHMTFYKGAFTKYHRLDQPIMITTATGALLQGVAEGIVELQIKEDSYYKTIRLSEVLHVIGLSGSLISVL
jgi:hypothetical protein